MNMTMKERIMATLRGEATDVIPYLPRLDIWYNGNSRNGTLPEKYKSASLREITDDLGFGYHAVVPNHGDLDVNGTEDAGLGLYDLRLMPYRYRFHNVEKKIEHFGNGVTRTRYITPKGTLTTQTVFTEQMKKSGVTVHVITEHAVKNENDLPAAAFLLQNIEVIPHYGPLQQHIEEYVGDRGPVSSLSSVFASAGHYLLKELMSVEDYYYTLFDHPEEIDAFAQQAEIFCERMFEAAVNSPADIIFLGSNYDSGFTSPDMFAKFITPYLKRRGEIVHQRGKFLLTHTDGENDGLLDEYLKAGFDISDSICPAPMTRLSLTEIRKVYGEKITIWGGVPSVTVLQESMSDYEFEKYIDDLFSNLGRGDHLIISVADMVPPGAKFERLLHIAKKAREFGPVKF